MNIVCIDPKSLGIQEFHLIPKTFIWGLNGQQKKRLLSKKAGSPSGFQARGQQRRQFQSSALPKTCISCCDCSLPCRNSPGGTAPRLFISPVGLAAAGARDLWEGTTTALFNHFFSTSIICRRFMPRSEKVCIHKCKHSCSSNKAIYMNYLM